jgi:hypothetical protein
MEGLKNTVVLDLAEYNALRDFKDNLSNSMVAIEGPLLYNGGYGVNYTHHPPRTLYYVSESEAIHRIEVEYERLKAEYNKLSKYVHDLEFPPGDRTQEPKIRDLKKMSWYQLLKWRFKK